MFDMQQISIAFHILVIVAVTKQTSHVIRKRGASGQCTPEDGKRVPCLKVISAEATSAKKDEYKFAMEILSGGKLIDNKKDMHISWALVHSNGSTTPLSTCKNCNACTVKVKLDQWDDVVIEVLVAVGFQSKSEKSISNIDLPAKEYIKNRLDNNSGTVSKRQDTADTQPVGGEGKSTAGSDNKPAENDVAVPESKSSQSNLGNKPPTLIQVETQEVKPPPLPVHIIIPKDRQQEENIKALVNEQNHKSNRRLSFIALMLSRLFKLLKIMKKTQHDYTERSEEIEEKLAAEFTRTMNKLWGSVSENIVRDDIELHQELAKTLKKVTDMFHSIQKQRQRDSERTRPKWSKWTKWSHCSVTCGPNGTVTRQRICVEFGRKGCNGSDIESRKCVGIQKVCPPVVQWSEWNSWRPCSKTCGSGWRVRTRTCYISKAENSCANDGSQIEKCDMNECPRAQVVNADDKKITAKRTTSTTTQAPTSPLPGHWTMWDMWSHCSVVCGLGYETRRRKCTFSPDLTDHFIQAAFEGRTIICDGPDSEEKKCIRNACDLENVSPIVRSVLGGDARLQCVFDETAHPIEISWITPAGERITADKPHGRYNMSGRNLYVHYVGPMDRGTFHCVVALSLGKFVTADCELAVVSCEDNPCKNGGSCVEMADETHEKTMYHFHCNCIHGFGGTFCEINQTLFWAVLGIVVVSVVLILICVGVCLFLRARQKKIFGEYKDLYETTDGESTGIDSSPERVFDVESPKKNYDGDLEVKETVREIGNIFTKIRNVQKDVNKLVQVANADNVKLGDAKPPDGKPPEGAQQATAPPPAAAPAPAAPPPAKPPPTNLSQNQRARGDDESDLSTLKSTSESIDEPPPLNNSANRFKYSIMPSLMETCDTSSARSDSDASRDENSIAAHGNVGLAMNCTPPFVQRRQTRAPPSRQGGCSPSLTGTQYDINPQVATAAEKHSLLRDVRCSTSSTVEGEQPEVGPTSKFKFNRFPKSYYHNWQRTMDPQITSKPPTGQKVSNSPRRRNDIHSPIVKAYRKAKQPASDDETGSSDDHDREPSPKQPPSARLSLFDNPTSPTPSENLQLSPRHERFDTIEADMAASQNTNPPSNISKVYASRKCVRTKLDFTAGGGMESGDSELILDQPNEIDMQNEEKLKTKLQRTPDRMAKFGPRLMDHPAANENQNNHYPCGDGFDQSPTSDLRSTSSSMNEASASCSQNSISSLIVKFEKPNKILKVKNKGKKKTGTQPRKSSQCVESRNISGVMLASARNSKRLSAAYKSSKHQPQSGNEPNKAKIPIQHDSAYRELVKEMKACIQTLAQPKVEESSSSSDTLPSSDPSTLHSVLKAQSYDSSSFDSLSTDSQTTRNSSAMARDDLMTWFDEDVQGNAQRESDVFGAAVQPDKNAPCDHDLLGSISNSVPSVELSPSAYVTTDSYATRDKHLFQPTPIRFDEAAGKNMSRKYSKGDVAKSVTFSTELTRQISPEGYLIDNECRRGNYATLSTKPKERKVIQNSPTSRKSPSNITSPTNISDYSPKQQKRDKKVERDNRTYATMSQKPSASKQMVKLRKESMIVNRYVDGENTHKITTVEENEISRDPDLDLLADIDIALSDVSTASIRTPILPQSPTSTKEYYTLTSIASISSSPGMSSTQPWWVAENDDVGNTDKIRAKLQTSSKQEETTDVEPEQLRRTPGNDISDKSPSCVNPEGYSGNLTRPTASALSRAKVISDDNSPSLQSLSLREVSDDFDTSNNNMTYQMLIESLGEAEYMDRIATVGDSHLAATGSRFSSTQTTTTSRQTMVLQANTTTRRKSSDALELIDVFEGVEPSGSS